MAHKKDCQCIVCQRVRAKALETAVVAAVAAPIFIAIETDPRPQLGDLPIGTNFRLGPKVFKKINNPGTVLDMTKPDDSSEFISPIIRVDVIGSGMNAKHEVEAER